MQVRAYKAVKADGTRRVYHLKRALDTLLSKNYYTVVSHLQHTSQPRDASIAMQGRAFNCGQKCILLFFPTLPLYHLEYSREHSRTVGNSLTCGSCFLHSLVFSNVCHVLSQCNAWFRILYLLNK